MPTVYRLDLAYEGTDFRGWAKQPGQRTVEGELERALRIVVREHVRLSVAGRTDAGVHALAQVASFRLARDDIEPRRLRLALNALLPPDVAVLDAARAADDFDARAARARTYRYRIWLPEARPVFERRYVWALRGAQRLNRDALARCAALLLGRRNFAALTPSAHLYRSCERTISEAVWAVANDGREITFTITGDSFLHNMVRVAVGSMVDVALGRLTEAAFAAGLASGRRGQMGQTAPAHGLALVRVSYGMPADLSA